MPPRRRHQLAPHLVLGSLASRVEAGSRREVHLRPFGSAAASLPVPGAPRPRLCLTLPQGRARSRFLTCPFRKEREAERMSLGNFCEGSALHVFPVGTDMHRAPAMLVPDKGNIRSSPNFSSSHLPECKYTLLC